MTALKRRVGIAIGILGVALLLNATQAGNAVAQMAKPLLVHIVNTSAAPVPTVLLNTTASPGLVRDVSDFAARNRFAQKVDFFLEDGIGYDTASVSIPVGKLLVVETVSAFALVGSSQRPAINLSTGTGSSAPIYEIAPLARLGVCGGGTCYAAVVPIRFYAGELHVLFSRLEGDDGGASARVTISGYLVDQP